MCSVCLLRVTLRCSALLKSNGVLALLHAFECDIDKGNQTLQGAQGTEQPVWISFAEDLQDITFVEAQLTRFSGNVVAQCSDFPKEYRIQKKRTTYKVCYKFSGGCK